MHGMREAQLGAVAPRRQAPLRKEQVCGRKTLGALVCGKGELRNRALPRAGTLHRRAGREGQLPCPEVAAAQLRLPLPARKGEFAVGHLRSVINIEPHAVPFGEAAGSRVIEAGARGGNREIQFKEVIAASCGRVVQITGAGRQQAGLKPQHHPYALFIIFIVIFMVRLRDRLAAASGGRLPDEGGAVVGTVLRRCSPGDVPAAKIGHYPDSANRHPLQAGRSRSAGGGKSRKQSVAGGCGK